MSDNPTPADTKPAPPAKPGYLSTEFYVTLAAKIFALLVALGVVNSSDADAYTKGISGIVGGIFVVASTYLAAHYTSKRTQAKAGALLLALLGALCLAGPAHAQAPRHERTAGCQVGLFNFGCCRPQAQAPQQAGPSYDPAVAAALNQLVAQNAQLNAQLQALLSQRGQPAPAAPAAPLAADTQRGQPIVYVLPGPGGAPQQQLPVAGQPQQQLPIGGAPQQQLPVAGQPQQQIIIHAPPQQGLPVLGAPQQQLPAPAAPAQPPAAPPVQQLLPAAPAQAQPARGDLPPAPFPQRFASYR